MLDDLLHYHGDQAAVNAHLDFAVNVRGATPSWLSRELAGALDKLAAYPTDQLDCEVRSAIAAYHGRRAEEVLLLHGVSEGFSLLPDLGLPATIIQPQFTEPEAAFRAAGAEVNSVQLPPPFALPQSLGTDSPVGHDCGESCQWYSQLRSRMVIVGNPTNPTGVAHSAQQLRALASRCEVLVVDEAFMDVADESVVRRCTMAEAARAEGGECTSSAKSATEGSEETSENRSSRAPGAPDNVIVFRSMTKTWAIAGLRCGYALGDPELLRRLARRRPHWPLGSLQLVAMAAIADRQETELPRIRREVRKQREAMTELLTEAKWQVKDSEAPFVLARPGADTVGKQEQLRLQLLDRGVAVRRCDTFAGLSGTWWRLAVRDELSVRRLIAEVERLRRQNQ